MRVIVQEISGKEVAAFDMAAEAKLSHLLKQVATKESVPCSIKLSLAFGDSKLPTDTGLSLEDCGIVDGSIVTVMKEYRPRVLTASNDGRAMIFESTTGKTLQNLKHATACKSAAWLPDASAVLTASTDSTARIWSTAGQELQQIAEGFLVLSCACSGDGAFMATAVNKNWCDATPKAYVYKNGSSVERIATLSADDDDHRHMRPITSVRFSPDGTAVLTASLDGTCKIWNISTAECIQTFRYDEVPEFSAVADFSKDGAFVVTGHDAGFAKIWGASSGECQLTISGEGAGEVTSAVFSSDDRLVLTGHGNGTAKIWNRTAECLLTLSAADPAMGGAVNSAAFSADDSLVVTAQHDCTVKIWSSDTGECLLTFSGHCSGVMLAVFEPL